MNLKIYRLRSTLANTDLVKKMNDEFLESIGVTNSDFNDNINSFVLIESGGTESLFVKILPELNKNVYLLTSGENNSLPASLEILTYLNQKGYNGEILHGNVNYVTSRLKSILDNSKKNTEVLFGSIGKPSDWLISSNVNERVFLSKLHAKLIYIDFENFLLEYEKKEYIPTDRTEELVKKASDKFDIQDALYVYGALKRIIKMRNLVGLTIRCFDLIKLKKVTACIALALLNEEGYIATCEGDQTAMASMYLARVLTGQSSFQTNPSLIDVTKNEIVFAHCTLPLDMVDSYRLDTHFESNLGVAIKGEMREEYVTVFRLNNELSDAFILEGKIIRNEDNKRRCRTQIRVKFDENIASILKNPYGNHHIIMYGKHRADIKKFFRE
ncbi:MAG: hypothetical protein MR766_04525 [Erysipelotrichaceae bacterium]|nr:hypothetical protein [Erysipelotrichaceae bacterium]